jgi:hypothetical protein
MPHLATGASHRVDLGTDAGRGHAQPSLKKRQIRLRNPVRGEQHGAWSPPPTAAIGMGRTDERQKGRPPSGG